jgi:cyclic pyranopterin monophosphate synthase
MVRFMTRAEPPATQREAIYAFEGIDEELPFLPLSARRILDAMGKKLSLAGWLSLAVEDRRRLVLAGFPERLGLDPASSASSLSAILNRAVPAPSAIEEGAEPDPLAPPPELLTALGGARPIAPRVWQSLRSLDRYALVKYAAKPEKLASAYDEIMGTTRLSHLTADGHAHMVDVGAKSVTARRAVASARICTSPAVVEAIAAGGLPKGDVLAVARVAGLMAAKRTPELIPLCHPVQTTRAAVDFEADPARGELRVRAIVEANDRTGVEMEAMVAASVAALTVYDMVKSADRWATIEGVRLEEKSGGKSGSVARPAERSPR